MGHEKKSFIVNRNDLTYWKTSLGDNEQYDPYLCLLPWLDTIKRSSVTLLEENRILCLMLKQAVIKVDLYKNGEDLLSYKKVIKLIIQRQSKASCPGLTISTRLLAYGPVEHWWHYI